MRITKDIIYRCLQDKREEIENAHVILRPYEFDENANAVMVGIRHVGKSYMLYQRVKQLLNEGHGWDEILFVDFDDERLAEFTTDDFNLLLEAHWERYGKRPYVFLDEAQNIPAWDKFARRLANEKYRVYITGSNAKMLSKDVATTLGGRFQIIEVYPYSFSEFLDARGVKLGVGWHYSTVAKSEVLRIFREYFLYGGLPEIVDYKQKRSMLSGLYQKIYLGDICQRNTIRNSRVLNLVIKKLAESVRQPISFNRLKNVVVSTGSQTSIPTIIDYTGYAEDSWLLLPVENELAKLSEKESTKKYYFVDNGILNLFLIDADTSLLENLVAIQLCRRFGRDNVSYYNAGKEIDFVVPEQRLAIQVCFSLSDLTTREREVTPLIQFATKHSDWRLLIITYDEMDRISCLNGKEIEVLPVWKWMLSEM